MEGNIYVQIWHCYRLLSCGFWCHVSYSVLDWYHFVRWICCLFQKWVFSKTSAPINQTTSLKIMIYILNFLQNIGTYQLNTSLKIIIYILNFLQNIGTYQPNYIPENYDLYLEFSPKHWHLSTKLRPWKLWFISWIFVLSRHRIVIRAKCMSTLLYIIRAVLLVYLVLSLDHFLLSWFRLPPFIFKHNCYWL